MVHGWDCPHCDYSIWAGNGSVVRDAVQSHLLEHHREALYEEAFQFGWHCPYCAKAELRHDSEIAIESFRDHLYEHAHERVESGTHVAAELSGTGNVLILASPNSPGTDNARVHFIAPCQLVILVTNEVEDRLRLLDRQLNAWPARTIVLTTVDQPLAGLDDVDISEISLEIVQLDRDVALSTLGETLSRVIAEHEAPNQRLSIGFELLPHIVDHHELEKVFKFLHLLTSRFDSADALSHFYWNPEDQTLPTLNLLAELFDLRIEVENDRFVRSV